MRSWKALRKVSVCTLLPFLLCACTKQEVRRPIELRHYEVDWAHIESEAVELPGIHLHGILLTPTQWPLEASVKRLFHGDFVGIIDALDFRFHSSKIPSGVLEDLYGRGFVPAYFRIENPSDGPLPFQPLETLIVRDRRGVELPMANPDELPMTLTHVDVETTLLAAGSIVLVVLAITAGREGRLNFNSANAFSGAEIHIEANMTLPSGSASDASSSAIGFSGGPDRSLLRPGMLGPKEVREGVILFWHKNASVDWGSAHLVAR